MEWVAHIGKITTEQNQFGVTAEGDRGMRTVRVTRKSNMRAGTCHNVVPCCRAECLCFDGGGVNIPGMSWDKSGLARRDASPISCCRS